MKCLTGDSWLNRINCQSSSEQNHPASSVQGLCQNTEKILENSWLLQSVSIPHSHSKFVWITGFYIKIFGNLHIIPDKYEWVDTSLYRFSLGFFSALYYLHTYSESFKVYNHYITVTGSTANPNNHAMKWKGKDAGKIRRNMFHYFRLPSRKP